MTRNSASILCNDPFAGSPTETLLQLLPPLHDEVGRTIRFVVVANLLKPVHRLIEPFFILTNTELPSFEFIMLRGNSDTRDQRRAFLRHVSLMARNVYLFSMNLISNSWDSDLGVLVEFKLLR